jgi:hypothetical protein
MYILSNIFSVFQAAILIKGFAARILYKFIAPHVHSTYRGPLYFTILTILGKVHASVSFSLCKELLTMFIPFISTVFSLFELFITPYTKSRNSPIGKVMGLGLNDQSSIPGRVKKIFPVPKRLDGL